MIRNFAVRPRNLSFTGRSWLLMMMIQMWWMGGSAQDRVTSQLEARRARSGELPWVFRPGVGLALDPIARVSDHRKQCRIPL